MNEVCLGGHIIGAQKSDKLMPWQLVGSCDGCANGPLHGTDNTCGCSVRRDKMRLCRRCAIALDLATKSWSPLLSNAENASVRLARTLDDPHRVIEREGEQLFRFEVSVASYGPESTTKNQVVNQLMRSLHIAFRDSVTVFDKGRQRTIPFDPRSHTIGGVTDTYTNGNGNGHA